MRQHFQKSMGGEGDARQPWYYKADRHMRCIPRRSFTASTQIFHCTSCGGYSGPRSWHVTWLGRIEQDLRATTTQCAKRETRGGRHPLEPEVSQVREVLERRRQGCATLGLEVVVAAIGGGGGISCSG
jgi:hypothetical protein